MVHVLQVPYGDDLPMRHGARWDKSASAYVHPGPLPRALRPYASAGTDSTTWEAWVQAVLNKRRTAGNPTPDPTTGSITLRDDQKEAVKATLDAHRAGSPLFFNGSGTGVGKTVMTIAAAKQIPGARHILVLAPLPVVAAWRATIKQMGDGGKRWLVVNYDKWSRLLAKPTPTPRKPTKGKKGKKSSATARVTAKMHARQGTPKIPWDVVILDEAHYLGNPASQRSTAVERIINNPQGTPRAFTIALTATAGRDPSKLSWAHHGINWITGQRDTMMNPKNYATTCARMGIGLSVGKYGELTWEGDKSDLEALHQVLYKPTSGKPSLGVRKVPDWPEQQRYPLPVDITPGERQAYQADWEDFKQALRLARKEPDASARQQAITSAGIRWRQKAGLILADHAADQAEQLISNGLQVVIACEFTATAQAIHTRLTGHHSTPTSLYTGTTPDREKQRLLFQQGHHKAIICTICEGINLHAGEPSSKATATQRATLIAEPRWSPVKALQVEGRAARDGKVAHAYYVYAPDTATERVMKRVISGMRNINTINGATDSVEDMAQHLGI